MRNLITVISLVFIAIVAVSYFYFANLDEKGDEQPPTATTHETEAQPAGPAKPEEQEEQHVEAPTGGGVLWTFTLNGGAITSPSVHQYGDSTLFILVQDAYHILHAISADGQKLWNAQLPGPIVDSISQLADRTLVFTTAERLYRLDTEGDPLPGFSLKLPQRATQGAEVSGQPTDGGAVRIEVGTSRQVLAYDGRGKLLRRQARSRSQQSGNNGRQADGPVADLPHDCGPLAYVGPLHGDGQRYLLCSKSDHKLYCFRY